MKIDRSQSMGKEYTHDTMHRAGMGIWPLMIWELAESRGLVWILAKRNISVKYRQSVLSYLWIVIPPLMAVGLFSYLSSNRIIEVGSTPIPYLSYALLNISIWLLFANTLISATKSLIEAGNLVTRVNFPKVTLVIASASDAILEFVIRMAAVIVVFYFQDVTMKWHFLPALMLLVPLMLLAMGLGFIFSILNLVVHDTSNLLAIGLTLGMFLTPVLYPFSALEQFVYLYLLNPLNPILENIHNLIATGEFINYGMLFATCLFSLTVFLAGWRIFNLTLPRISERA